MSRSFKKTPGFCDRSPFNKRQANKRVRRISTSEEIADGSSYRKYFNPWNICDFKSLYFSKEHMNRIADEYYGGKRHQLKMK